MRYYGWGDLNKEGNQIVSKFGMVGKLTADPADRDQLVDILTQAAALMTDIDDCLLYVVSKDVDNAGDVWVMELWESKAAHDESLTQPEVRALISQAMPILKGNPDGVTLLPVGGKGL